ncbi:MAG: CBS domain-containing protein [Actinomycetales bacterium]|nr:CBS domain-containing protein [Actinomycetales bacterium]
MNVANLLATKGRDVATINQERSVHDAIAMLKERGIGALVVTGGTGPLTGMLSERDVVRAFAREGADALDLRVAALMTTAVITCHESTSLNELMTTMTDKRIRHVPVVENGQLVGLVSIGDVVKARVGELEGERRDLLEYVNAR